jgi:hypothetical protein
VNLGRFKSSTKTDNGPVCGHEEGEVFIEAASEGLGEHGPQQRRERDSRANLVRVREIDEDGCVDAQRTRGVFFRGRWSRKSHGSARSGATGSGVGDLRTRVLSRRHRSPASTSRNRRGGSSQGSVELPARCSGPRGTRFATASFRAGPAGRARHHLGHANRPRSTSTRRR